MSQTFGNDRELWIVANTGTRPISIGDLPKIPTINPGSAVNVLRYYDKDIITQSKVLLSGMNSGILSMIKKIDSASSAITAVQTNDALDVVTKEEMLGAEGGSFTTATVSSDCIAVAGTIILATGRSLTITLPLASSSSNHQIVVKKTSSDASTVTVAGQGGDTIDGETSVSIVGQYTSLTFVSDGSNWYIISADSRAVYHDRYNAPAAANSDLIVASILPANRAVLTVLRDPDVPRNLRLYVNNPAPPMVAETITVPITVTGVDSRGVTQSEVITSGAVAALMSKTVDGSCGFLTITSITVGDITGTPQEDSRLSVGWGNKVGLTQPLRTTADVLRAAVNGRGAAGAGVTYSVTYSTADLTCDAPDASKNYDIWYREN